MNALKIYFVTEKTTAPLPNVESLMRSEINNNFKIKKPDYLKATIVELNNNQEVKKSVEEMVTKEPILYTEIAFEAVINGVPNDNNWMFDTPPAHTYNLRLSLKSIEYTCVKIIDDKNYLCFHSNDKELKIITKNKDSKVYVAD